MNMKKYRKNAYSLLEISIALVIVSFLLILVIGSVSIIENGKVMAIGNDINMYENAVKIFYDDNGCLPGDCERGFIVNKVSKSFAAGSPGTTKYCLNTVSSTSPAFANSRGIIIGSDKSTCAFWELSDFGLIRSGLVQHKNLLGYDYSATMSGYHNPYVSKNSEVSWHLATMIIDNTAFSGVITRPSEVLEYGITKSNYLNRQAIVALSSFPEGRCTSVTKSSCGGSIEFSPFISGSLNRSSNLAGMSAGLAKKVDEKFDDGYPYSGDIISGRDGADSASDSAANPSNPVCTVLTGNLAESTVASGAIYSSSYSAKCIFAFIMDRFER